METWQAFLNWWHSWGRMVILVIDIAILFYIVLHGISKNSRWPVWAITTGCSIVLMVILEFTLRRQPTEGVLFVSLLAGLLPIPLAIAYAASATAGPRQQQVIQSTVGGTQREASESKPPTEKRESYRPTLNSTIPVHSLQDNLGKTGKYSSLESNVPFLITGEGSSASFAPIKSDPFTIGRRGDNHLVLDNPTVSRQHALISKKEGAYFIEDSNSAAGTIVNGAVIETTIQLLDGDVIELGTARIIFKQP